MQVHEVMSKDPCMVAPSVSLKEAAQIMRDNDVGCLPVGEDNGSLVGILTDRDITIRAVAEGLDLQQTKAQDIMTENVATCFEDIIVEDVAKLMGRQKIRRVVVLNRDSHRMSGIISVSDFATRGENDTLNCIIEGTLSGKVA